MFRYELKNKMKMAAFIAALPGFMEALQRAGQTGTFDNVYYCVGSVHTENMDAPGEWRVNIPADEVEAIEPYNPNRWNNYPAVKPPIGVPMRIEYKTCKGHIGGILALFFDGMWHRCTPDGTTCFLTLDRDVKRFRPWDDDFKPTEWVAPCKSL